MQNKDREKKKGDESKVMAQDFIKSNQEKQKINEVELKIPQWG